MQFDKLFMKSKDMERWIFKIKLRKLHNTYCLVDDGNRHLVPDCKWATKLHTLTTIKIVKEDFGQKQLLPASWVKKDSFIIVKINLLNRTSSVPSNVLSSKAISILSVMSARIRICY